MKTIKTIKTNAKSKAKKIIALTSAAVLAFSLSTTAIPSMHAYAATDISIEYSVNENMKRNVMYYGDWSIWGGQGNFYPQGIAVENLTHLNFAFIDFDANGNLMLTDKDAAFGAPVGMAGVQWGAANAGIMSALQELRAKNPNLRIGISVGGWSKSGDFSAIASNPTARANFVNNIMKFIDYTNMDFVDLDWEYPGSVRDADLVDNKNDEGTPRSSAADKANYITLLSDLKAALNKQGTELGKTYELSVALPAPKSTLGLGVDIQQLFSVVDYANIMTYDMRGAWDNASGHQTALYTNPNDPHAGKGLSVDECVQYLISNGAPSNKIVIGAAMYTRGWEKVADNGTDASNPGLFGSAEYVKKDADNSLTRGADNEAAVTTGDGGRRGGVWSYRSIDKLKAAYPGLVEYWDDTAKAPYLYNKTTGAFFTYDNQRSIAEKASYVNQYNLGGMISWMASQDGDISGGKRGELTKAIKDGLFGSNELQSYNINTSTLDIQTTIGTYSENNTKGYTITIKNNEKSEESNTALKLAEINAETVKSPKLYITTKSGATFTTGGYGSGAVSNKNGMGIVDLTTVYENKMINQGQTISFKLATSNVDLSDIVSIELAQSIIPNSTEIAKQVIFGENIGNVETPKEVINQKPVISGAISKTITVGDTFSALTGVTATDVEDGALNVTVSGTVNAAVAGTYTLTYSATDSKNAQTTATRVITVVAKQVINQKPVISGVTNKTITVGDTFSALTGVTATDVEDGALNVTVSGTVNAAVAGTYTLTYSATDSNNAQTTATRVITVVAKQVINQKPVISGVTNKTITVGDTFSALTGVTATDVEDGALNVTVSGTVNAAVAGTYTLTYSATDSKNAQTTATCVITVKAKDVTPEPTTPASGSYNTTKVYLAGDQVTYNGQSFKAKWWTQGNIPGAEQWGPWELTSAVVTPTEPTTEPTDPTTEPTEPASGSYNTTKVYLAGDQVTYNGQSYKAKWWTQGNIPGTEQWGPWELTK